jgi:SAM-dependent methyltransferase
MSEVIWHDIECGSYRQDLAVWLALADQYAGAGAALLDVGAGTGRVSLALARAGHTVVALDHSRALLAELARRAAGLPVQIVHADARNFTLPGHRFPLIVAPMQTFQLLGGAAGQQAFMRSARRHLQAGGVIAMAIVALEDLEEFDGTRVEALPLPDIAEHDGCAYFSQPTAVRREQGTIVLERVREVVNARGERRSSVDRTRLDLTDPRQLAELAASAGMRLLEVRRIDETDAHVGSEVVILQ